MSSSNQVQVSNPPQDAISSIKFFPQPGSTRYLVSSWNKHVYVYDLVNEDGSMVEDGGRVISKIEHRAPVLEACWGKDEDEAYSVGLDWDVRKIDLKTGSQTVLSSHTAGANSVVYSSSHSLLISASWDKTLHIHQTDYPTQPPATIRLPEKPFSLSASSSKLVVAMANRALHIYDLQALKLATAQAEGGESNTGLNAVELEAWQRRESSLKFMTRAVSCMPDDAGYASSSIEGRVAVEWFDPSSESQARKYAFKCHRQTSDGVDVVYPVNCLAYHPRFGSFASGGGDGVVALWDGIAKRRIRQYQKFPASVAAVAFSADGKYLVVGVSPGFEEGKEDVGEGPVGIFVRTLGETEAKGKGQK